uniref:Major facilitator superfamily (MFS) profile domain-containing protein n=1 Tax=Panagrolaimus sp. JU765 TaxID=591449 RepID=A0AC34QAR4_9BILA
MSCSSVFEGPTYQLGGKLGRHLELNFLKHVDPHVAYKWFNESHHRTFGNYLDKSENTLAWSVTVGLFNLGGMIGGFIACRLADRIGRRNTLIANNTFICTGIFFMTFAKYVDFYLFLPIGRLITGTGSGIASAIVPMYLTEISPINKRGTLGSIHQLTFTFSNFIATIFGLPQIFGNTNYWPLIFTIALVPTVIQMTILPLCPESP